MKCVKCGEIHYLFLDATIVAGKVYCFKCKPNK